MPQEGPESGLQSLSAEGSFSRVSNLQPVGSMRPRMATNVAQHKILNLLKTFLFAHQFLLVVVYLMCGPRQLFHVTQRRQKVGHPCFREQMGTSPRGLGQAEHLHPYRPGLQQGGR